MNIQELKTKSSENLISQAEELGIENASTLRKQEILFSILKKFKLWKKLPIKVRNYITKGLKDKKLENLNYADILIQPDINNESNPGKKPEGTE